MEQIDVQEIRRQQSAVTAAWRRWEEDAKQEGALRSVLKAAQTQLAAWEQDGHYLGTPGRLLASQVATVEALLVQRAQERTRGY